MCGIAGFISPGGGSLPSRVLDDMGDAIIHRGPDEYGDLRVSTRDGIHNVGLIHRRLSIIDLTTGRQPMANEDNTVHIVFNGEIYNYEELREQLLKAGHAFSTSSDTEVIVHAYEQWGTGCVEKFRGMFSFAIWDARNDRLFLARDRYGKKPLFLFNEGGVLVFASEIKSILRFPGIKAEVDLDSVSDYLIYRYVPSPHTLYKRIYKLMPGSFALWECGRLTEKRYYEAPDAFPVAPHTENRDVVTVFLQMLEDAVRIRMVSDVPFGAFLSGGIDSSAVVAMMCRHATEPVKTFSIGFEGEGYSELEYASHVAKCFRTDHHELTVSPLEIISLLPKLVHYRDAPVAEPSDIPFYLLAMEARRTVKMVLTGEGADEILGGYPKHVYENFVHAYQHVPSVLRAKLIEPLVRSLPYRCGRIKTAVMSMGIEPFEARMPRWFGVLSESEKRKLVVLDNGGRSASATTFNSDKANSPLRKILFFDQMSWLPDNLLERGDRMTMAASIEGRMPFLDHELVKFVSSLPDQFRVRRTKTKWILREAMRRALPSNIIDRRKVGFKVPVNEWMRGPMRDYIYDLLASKQSLTASYYCSHELQNVLSSHMAAKQNHEKLIWMLLSLEVWHRECLTTH